MAKIEDWHIGLSRLVCGQALHGGYQNINELIQAGAQLIADSVPHAPASTEQKTEIGVDTEKVWGMAEFRTKVCLRCNKLWQDCGNSNHNDGYDAVVFTHKQLAAALKAAGGGK